MGRRGACERAGAGGGRRRPGGAGPSGREGLFPRRLRGLTAALPAVSVGSCQGNWTAPQGVLYSPDFPDEYGPDRNCSWALGPQGAALELTFRLFELADPRDRLELRDAASGSLLRAFDGARPPPPGPLRLRAAALLLTFRSDARGHGQGFALTYRGEAPPAPAPRAPRLASHPSPQGCRTPPTARPPRARRRPPRRPSAGPT